MRPKKAHKPKGVKKPNSVRKIKTAKKTKVAKHPKVYVPRKANDIPTSKIEELFGRVLLSEGIKVKPQKQVAYKFYDFEIEGTNILLELDGDYYHTNPNVYPDGPINAIQRKNIKNDLFKNQLALSNGFVLIRIWESDFKSNPSAIIKKIKSFL